MSDSVIHAIRRCERVTRAAFATFETWVSTVHINIAALFTCNGDLEDPTDSFYKVSTKIIF